jgi:hypothetical protein
MMFTPRQTLVTWINPKAVIRESDTHGRGMFAVSEIVSGDVVLKWGGTVFTKADLDAGKAKAGTVAILSDNLYLADPADTAVAADYHLNHSCDPNLWMGDEITLVARCDIAPGEELTVDYALWECEPSYRLDPCRCGSPLCRGRITGDDWRLSDLQERYAGHFVPYINRMIGA